MQLGVLAGIALISEILPFTPLKSNGIVHLAAHVLNDVGLMPDRQLARLETDEGKGSTVQDALQITIDKRQRIITIKF
jgi:hypothetical protein